MSGIKTMATGTTTDVSTQVTHSQFVAFKSTIKHNFLLMQSSHWSNSAFDRIFFAAFVSQQAHLASNLIYVDAQETKAAHHSDTKGILELVVFEEKRIKRGIRTQSGATKKVLT